MLESIISVILVVVGFINLIPAIGLLGSEKLLALYGLTIEDSNMLILMSHRSVLFGVLGVGIIISAWNQEFQVIAFITGLVSMLSFVLLARLIGNYNVFINKVVWVDVIASFALVVAWSLYYLKQ